MYLFYVDESGNTGLNLDSSGEPVHWMLALAVNAEAVKSTEAELLALALRTFRATALQPEFEFQGSGILNRRGPFAGLDTEQLLKLYAELLGVARKNECALFIQGIDKARYRTHVAARGEAPVHPHKLAFTALLERIDGWLGEAQPMDDLFGDVAGPPVYGLIVADEQADADREVGERFAFWRGSGAGTADRPELRFLLDTIHFVPSRESWLMQLVDCVAHLKSGFETVVRERGWSEIAYSAAERGVVRLWLDNCAELVVSETRWP